ncbi:hypothetical protein GGF37_001899 [Kickxella alabastrina]|nr:hypothetical protein GGF37_001899 [Kickxella alabastrina]
MVRLSAISGLSFATHSPNSNGQPTFGMAPNFNHDPQHLVNGSHPNLVDRAQTPMRAPNGTAGAGPMGMSSSTPSGASAQAMMSMFLQHKQQQQQQQQQQQFQEQLPTTPKPTFTPLSPDYGNAANGHHVVNQNGSSLSTPTHGQTPGMLPGMIPAPNQQLLEAWKKSTRVFLTHGNARISKELGIQLAAPDSSLFMHISLGGIDTNHALSVPRSANSILLRPVPGPYSANGKIIVMVSANGSRQQPREISDSNAQPSDNGLAEDTPSMASEEADKDDSQAVGALIKSANFAYEVPLQTGMNFIDIEVLTSEWRTDAFSGEGSDQQVPPALLPNSPNPAQTSKHYMFFLTRN